MNDLARQQLVDLIKNYGPSVTHMQRSCEMFVRQHCSQCPTETELFIQALQGGIVSQIQGLSATEPWEAVSAPLVRRMADHSGLPEEDARWVVDSWAIALRKHPAMAGKNQEPIHADEPWKTPSRGVFGGHKFSNILTVATAGAIGGAAGSALIYVLLAVVFEVALEDQAERKNITMLLLLLGALAAGLGGLGGVLGATGVWLLVGASDPLTPLSEAAERRMMQRAFVAILSGSFMGSAIGGGVCGFIFGTLTGGFGGAASATIVSAYGGGGGTSRNY